MGGFRVDSTPPWPAAAALRQTPTRNVAGRGLQACPAYRRSPGPGRCWRRVRRWQQTGPRSCGPYGRSRLRDRGGSRTALLPASRGAGDRARALPLQPQLLGRWRGRCVEHCSSKRRCSRNSAAGSTAGKEGAGVTTVPGVVAVTGGAARRPQQEAEQALTPKKASA